MKNVKAVQVEMNHIHTLSALMVECTACEHSEQVLELMANFFQKVPTHYTFNDHWEDAFKCLVHNEVVKVEKTFKGFDAPKYAVRCFDTDTLYLVDTVRHLVELVAHITPDSLVIYLESSFKGVEECVSIRTLGLKWLIHTLMKQEYESADAYITFEGKEYAQLTPLGDMRNGRATIGVMGPDCNLYYMTFHYDAVESVELIKD
ncbi:MAG: hypothetical protein KHX13_04755 [Acidaminococcus intestini]|uniref:Uncharacterized protein n=1 Tax=Acidaminococcus intestini TaxID=187327 RepID=A0A943EDE8_9FIRM|nr:hypothetical protein [Acidaminococcus intestini]